MIREYNMLEREFANGVHEIRLYKRGITKGTTREPPVINTFTEPFSEKKVYCSKMLDADGFTIARDNRISQQKSLARTINKIFDYANAMDWDWFITFTFSSEKVDRYDFDSVSKCMSKWLNNMKQRYCSEMLYLVVPELHKDGAWHFHGLFKNCEGLNFQEAVNNNKNSKFYKCSLIRKGQQVYNALRFKLGFTDCTKIKDSKRASSYITKYITKDVIIKTPHKRRYWCSKNLTLPKEKILLANYSDFDELKNKMVLYLSQFYNEIYTKTVEFAHGDFDNEIVYIRFSDDDWNGLLQTKKMDGIFEVE